MIPGGFCPRGFNQPQLAGLGGGRTVSLGKLQALRVLNFIRFECVIVKVKSREMTALSKSNREKIWAVKDQRKAVSGPTWGQLPAEKERETIPLWLCLCASLSLSPYQGNRILLVFEYTLEGGGEKGQRENK